MRDKKDRNIPRLVCLVISVCWFAFTLYGLDKRFFYLDNFEDWFAFFIITLTFMGGSYFATSFVLRRREARKP